MTITNFLEKPEGAAQMDRRDRLPEAWRVLALAALGDPMAVASVSRQGGEVDDAMLKAAAVRWGAKLEWGSTSIFPGREDSFLGQWRTICLGRSKDVAGRIALMDTTTLYTVLKLVDAEDSRFANPSTLLDLVTFLNTSCHYDRICFLENRHVSLAELEKRFGANLFVELPVGLRAESGSAPAPFGDVREELRSLYKYHTVPWINDVRAGRFGTDAQRAAWVSAWTTILDRDCNPDWLLRDPDDGASPDYDDVWSTPAEDLFNNIVEVMSDQFVWADQGRDLRQGSGRVLLAQESNARGLFNANLAGVLGVPYAASTPRFPIMNLLIESNRRNLDELRSVSRAARALEDAFGEDFLGFAGEPDVLQLPFFASAIFQKVSRPQEIPDVLASVRRRSERLREFLQELNAHLYLGDNAARQAKRELHAAFGDRLVWKDLGSPAEIGICIGHVALLLLDPAHAALTFSVALLYGIVATTTTMEILRSTRPQYRIIRDLYPAVNSAEAARRLWGIDNVDRWTARMSKLVSIAS